MRKLNLGSKYKVTSNHLCNFCNQSLITDKCVKLEHSFDRYAYYNNLSSVRKKIFSFITKSYFGIIISITLYSNFIKKCIFTNKTIATYLRMNKYLLKLRQTFFTTTINIQSLYHVLKLEVIKLQKKSNRT